MTKAESDSVAKIFIEQMLLMYNEGAAHRNIFCVTVRCTFIVLFKISIYKYLGALHLIP